MRTSVSARGSIRIYDDPVSLVALLCVVPFVFVPVAGTGAPLITTKILANKVSTRDDVQPTALAALPELDLPQRLAVVRNTVSGRIVFTTSFGIEDQAIALT